MDTQPHRSFGAIAPGCGAPLLGFPLTLVGFLDDRHNLPASWRCGVHLATAMVVILVSPLVALSFGLLPLLVIDVSAVITFTNLMYGLDGLLAGCMAVTIAALANALAALGPGGCPARLPALELEPGKGVHARCGQHLPGRGVCWPGAPGHQLTQCTRLQPLHLSHGCSRHGLAAKRMAMGGCAFCNSCQRELIIGPGYPQQ